MRRFIAFIILAPLAIVIVAFAMANREIVALSFDPFDSVKPAFTVRMPMFIMIFVLVGIGVLVGGVAAWLKQHKWRARARRAEADARDLRNRLDADRPRRSVPATLDRPTIAVPPAA